MPPSSQQAGPLSYPSHSLTSSICHAQQNCAAHVTCGTLSGSRFKNSATTRVGGFDRPPGCCVVSNSETDGWMLLAVVLIIAAVAGVVIFMYVLPKRQQQPAATPGTLQASPFSQTSHMSDLPQGLPRSGWQTSSTPPPDLGSMDSMGRNGQVITPHALPCCNGGSGVIIAD